MSGLPEGWVETPVNALVESRSGNSKLIKGTLLKESAPGSFPAFSASGQDVWMDFAEHEGDAIIVSAVGARCGKAFLASGKWSAIANTHIIFPKSDLADQRWLWFRLNDENFWERGGSAQPFVKVSKSLEREIPLPPLPEQRRIVKKVDGLTARTQRARKELDRIPTLIARYKQRLLALAFSGELTGGSESWRTATIGDLAETQLGKMLDKAKNRGEPTRYLRNINVRWYGFELDDVLEMPMSGDERDKFSIVDGDILTCEGGEPGRSAIWSHGPTDLAFQKALIRIRPDLQRLNPSYLVHHLKYLADAGELEQYFTGSTIKHLPQRALQRIAIPLPPIKEQAEIVRRIESAFGWLDRMAADHAAAARLLPKLDAAILSKAFRGELVPQDPNDEPASVLLERVRAERKDGGGKPKAGRLRRSRTEIITDFVDEMEHPPMYLRAQPRRKANQMTKSRQDDDVKGQAYLAGLLKSASVRDVQSLFRAADLPVADFYKQLAWEIDKGHIIDNPEELKAA